MTVKDVMTTEVAAVRANAPFHTIAALLIDRGVSGVPVVDAAQRVVGVVSEADLVRKEEFKERYYGEAYRPPLRTRLRHRLGEDGDVERRAAGDTAEELMTSPAVVTTPDSSIVLVARMMDRHGVKRLPVVASDGTLVGIVSRRDVIRVFVRSDAEIERRVRDDVIVRNLWADPEAVRITSREGIVTISGELETRSQAAAAVRVTRNLDGVVDVVDELSWRADDTVPVPVVWGGA
ncbi:CBS domain-containing protein [Planomonospora sp. ID91781]|uniref:CBS domain-containing protein n=1 Tax=Planomonospora sp. ID91781 TaxID=2738135 RepID=UPI0018C4168E|nr:CBS domain-containing protein [Planomonospora sp. ID91781]MBG0825206.1 CBS domain-containing protein [Planomonospora sp. ID91781]